MTETIVLVGFGGCMVGFLWHLARRYYEAAKRVVDVVLSGVLLVLLAPLLMACAALIRLRSAGSAIFTQVRVGKNGRLFRMYKFRTMYRDAEHRSGAVWAGHDDPRVVPGCRWMRRSHVDELPQLLNVLKGEMSLVGPRPERPEILVQLQSHYPQVMRRLAVRPGITGLAQIRNGYDTTIAGFSHKLHADLEYIEMRRWGLDLSILLRTFTKLNDRLAH